MNFLHRRVDRRTFLRAGAVTISLPLLDAMLPRGLGAEARAAAMRPRRLLLIARELGCNAEYFFPEQTGPDYVAPRYLKLIERHRGRFTVISGMSHLGYPNSHHTEPGLFSGMAPERIQRADDIHPTVSLDQFVAERIGRETRFPCVLLGKLDWPLSYNRQGVPVSSDESPEMTFRRLFLEGSKESIEREVRRLQDGRSILDGVREQLKSLTRGLGAEDRDRLDLLAASIREAEEDLRQSEAWAARPKPVVARRAEEFQNPGWSSGQKMRYDLAALAFQTDSTRVVVVLEGQGAPGDAPDTQLAQHDASHHGQEPGKIEQFARYEEAETRNIGGLLDALHGVADGDGTLLDHTMVLWASNIGNPSAHASSNLPVFIAGGGFKHQGHLAFDRKNNKPLSNLYVRFAQRMGLDTEQFGSSTGAFTELG